jgi:hypothetical protein
MKASLAMVKSISVWEGVAMDSLKFHPNPL